MAKDHFLGCYIDDSSKEARKHFVKLFLHASGSIAARFLYDQVCIADHVHLFVAWIIHLIPTPFPICHLLRMIQCFTIEYATLHIFHSLSFSVQFYVPAFVPLLDLMHPNLSASFLRFLIFLWLSF